MAKLHQIVAIAEGKKSRGQQLITKAHHMLQRTGTDGGNNPLAGISKTYRPVDEDGEKLPPEAKRVQVRVKEVIAEVTTGMTDLYDTLLTQDVANTAAKADVTVDGIAILKGVPVTHLMYLEKQLADLHTFVEKLPTLDPAYDWTFNDKVDCYSTPPTETHRTKKVPRNHVLAEATDKHPAQVQVYNEDILCGYWSTTLFNGSIPAKDRNDMLARVRKLQDAVKFARNEANSIEVKEEKQAKKLFDFVFGVQS